MLPIYTSVNTFFSEIPILTTSQKGIIEIMSKKENTKFYKDYLDAKKILEQMIDSKAFNGCVDNNNLSWKSEEKKLTNVYNNY